MLITVREPRGTSGGSTRTVFDLLRGPHWTLLAFTEQAPDLDGLDRDLVHVYHIATDDTAEMHDTAGEAHRAYSPQGDEVILIRPDGYIAARLPASDAAHIHEYLSTHLATRPPDTAAG